MATQTKTQRQAAGHKAAATRKRGEAKRSAATTRSSARQTKRATVKGVRSNVSATSRSARRTSRQAGRTSGLGLDAAGQRVEELGRRAQRALYIQVGAAANVRERVARAAHTLTDVRKVTLEFNRLERRGARAVGSTGRTLGRRQRALRTDAGALVARVKQIVR